MTALPTWGVHALTLLVAFQPPAHSMREPSLKLNETWKPSTPVEWFGSELRHLTEVNVVPMVLGPGAGYYLGLLQERNGNFDSALGFWEYSVKTDPEPWMRLAQDAATQLLLREKRSWTQVLRVVRSYLDRSPNDPAARRLLIRGLVESGDFSLALQEWDRSPPSLPGRQAERSAFQSAMARASMITSRPDALDRARAFLLEFEASQDHVEFHRFLLERGLLGRLPAWLAALSLFRSELASGRHAQAVGAIQPHLSRRELYDRAEVWNDLVRAYARSGRAVEGDRVLSPKATRLQGRLGLAAWSALGRLRAQASNHRTAIEAFLKAAEFATDSEKDSLYQQAAQNAFELSFEEGVKILQSAPWVDASLYNRLIQTQAALAVREKRWSNVVSLYTRLRTRLSLQERLNLQWLLLRLHRHGHIRWRSEFGPSPSQLLQELARHGGISYPVLMARFSLGLPLLEIRQSRWPEGGAHSTDAFHWGFLRFGLAEVLFERYDFLSPNIDWKLVRTLLDQLLLTKKYRPALRLISRLSGRPDWSRGMAEWKILYPLAYWKEIKSVSEREGIDPWLFLSLVREESQFDPMIHSPVGATGLSQLMPATFREQSRRMQLESPDIYDPYTNLSIGANYFGMRLKSLKHPSKALMAYNAGAHRVFAWRRFMDSLPDELMVEAVPFFETRNYVKRILATRMIYAFLYGEGTLEEAVASVLPRFQP